MSSHRTRLRHAILAAAALAASPILSSSAQTSGTYAGPSGYSWGLATNWSGSVVPDSGGTATLVRNTNQFSTLAINLDVPNITLSNLIYNQRNSMFVQPVTGTTNKITLTGPASVVTQPGQYGITPTAFAAVGHRFTTIVDGVNGVNVSGGGAVWLASTANLFTGNVTVNNTALTVNTDGALGNTANSVVLTGNAGLQPNGAVASGATRNYSANGGTLTVYSLANLDISGNLTGNSALYKAPFYSNSIVLRGTANTLSGPVVIGQGTLSLTGSGATLAPASIVAGGTLDIGDSTGATSNRITNAAPLTLRGGVFSYRSSTAGASTTQTMGALTLSGGQSQLLLSTNNTAGLQANFASLARQNSGIVFARGGNLGNAPANGVGNIKFTAAPTLSGGGGAAGTFNRSILPYGYGVQSLSAGVTDLSTAFLTYDVNGLRPLNLTTEARSTMASVAAPDENVRLVAAESLAADTTINSLQLNSGTLNGTGTLTVTSGGILSGGLASSTAPNIIDPNVHFGSAEGVIMAPGVLLINGAMSGSNGVSYGGGNLIAVGSLSTYSGPSTVTNGFVIFNGDVPSDNVTPTAFGTGTSPLIFAPGTAGVSRGAIYADAAANSTITFGRNIEIKGEPIAGTPGRGCIGTNGNDAGESLEITGNVAINGGFLNFEGDNTGTIGISGVISGSGIVSDTAFATPAVSQQAFRAANTYSGGTEIRDGIYLAGNNQAFGTGKIWFANSTAAASGVTLQSAMGAIGGAKTISNYIEMRSSTGTGFLGVMFAGDSPLTLNGTIDLGDTNNRLINIGGPTPQNIDFAGNINYGGIIKQGAGTLILSGTGSFGGQVQVNEGAVVLKSSTALGVNNAFAFVGDVNGFFPNFVSNNGFLVIDGSAGSLNFGAENIVLNTLSSSGAAIRNIAGNNSITGALYIPSNDHSVDVSTGSSFTSLLRDNSGTLNNASITKIGGGQLNVDRLRLSTANINDGTVRLTGSGTLGQGLVSNLNIAAGTTLDIGNTGLIVATTPVATLKPQIVSGRNGGAWTGTGIRTSSAVTSGHKTGIGYADGASVVNPSTGLADGSYSGQSILATDTIIAHTYLGDANLDRKVDSTDFAASFGNAANYGLTAGAEWKQGDFNYDGKVNTEDFNELAGNFGLTLAAPLPGPGLEPTSLSGLVLDDIRALVMQEPDGAAPILRDSIESVNLRGARIGSGASLGAVVPEPTCISLLALAGAGLLGRRRKM